MLAGAEAGPGARPLTWKGVVAHEASVRHGEGYEVRHEVRHGNLVCLEVRHKASVAGAPAILISTGLPATATPD